MGHYRTAARACPSSVSALAIQSVEGVPYGERRSFGAVTVSFIRGAYPGVSPGSGTARRRDLVVTGDFKREPDPTCAPFETVPCDVLVTEATFAYPIYQWPDPDTS